MISRMVQHACGQTPPQLKASVSVYVVDSMELPAAHHSNDLVPALHPSRRQRPPTQDTDGGRCYTAFCISKSLLVWTTHFTFCLREFLARQEIKFLSTRIFFRDLRVSRLLYILNNNTSNECAMTVQCGDDDDLIVHLIKYRSTQN